MRWLVKGVLAPEGFVHRLLNTIGDIILRTSAAALLLALPFGPLAWLFEGIFEDIWAALLAFVAWSFFGTLLVMMPLKWLGAFFFYWEVGFTGGLRDGEQT